MDLTKIKEFLQSCEEAIQDGGKTPEQMAADAKNVLPPFILMGLKMQTSGQAVVDKLKPLCKSWGFDPAILESNAEWLEQMLTALKAK